MLEKLLVKLVINAVALWVAALVVSGITFSGPGALLVMAVVLGIVNTVVGWPLKLMSFPLILITFGLFILVINAFLFKFSASFAPGFDVNGWGAGLLGSIVTSVVSWVLGKVF